MFFERFFFKANQYFLNYRRTFKKLYNQTLRNSGPEAGTRDVIKALRNMNNPKSFFRDLYKVNSKLNQNNVKISFGPDGTVLMNEQVPVVPAELRNDLRNLPAHEVFANVPPMEQPMLTSPLNGSLQQAPIHANSSQTIASTSSGGILAVTSYLIFKGLTIRVAQDLARWAYHFYQTNRQLLSEELQIHFDDRFFEDIWRITRFLARHTIDGLKVYLARVTAEILNERIRCVYDNRLVAATMSRIADALYLHYEHILQAMSHIQNRIANTESFMETILELLEDLTHVVVIKIVNIAKMLLIAFQNSDDAAQSTIGESVEFENFFDEVFSVLITMARRSGLVDFSAFIILLEKSDMDEIHEEVSRVYKYLRQKLTSSTTIKCGQCCGSYSTITI